MDTLTKKTNFLTDWVMDAPYEDETVVNDVASLYAGSDYSAIITEKGNVYMWGINNNPNAAILGDRNDSNNKVQPTPTLVYASGTGDGYIENVVRLSPTSHSEHVLVHANTGVVYAWGDNTMGQLGDGTGRSSGNSTGVSASAPVVTGASPLQFSPSQRQITLDLSRNPTDTLVLTVGQTLMMVYGDRANVTDQFEWKSLDESIVTVRPAGGNSMRGVVTSFREGETKVLAQNPITGQSAFARVIVTDGITYPQLVLGEYTSTALKKDGTVWAWGDNTFRDEDDVSTGIVGKLGTGSQQSVLTAPVQLSYYKENPASTELRSFENLVRVVAGDSFTVALGRNGAVYTWGDNRYGQLGYDPNLVPYSEYPVKVTFPDSGARFIAIAAGANHVLAVTEEGMVYTWGDNQYGQLGHGYKGGMVYEPTPMLGFTGSPITDVMDVAATVGTSAILLTNGTVWTVGSNLHGELGIGRPIVYYEDGRPESGVNVEAEENYSTRLVRVESSAAWDENVNGGEDQDAVMRKVAGEEMKQWIDMPVHTPFYTQV